MAYEPTNWKTGDVVTSAKLNKLEQGVAAGSGALVNIGVTVDEQAEVATLQKTGQEILDYVSAGLIPYIDFGYTYEEVSFHFTALFRNYATEPDSSATVLHVLFFDQGYVCDALSDYPSASLN